MVTFLIGFVVCIGLVVVASAYSPANAFQYTSLPSDNLIQNAWFRSPGCTFSITGWQTNPPSLWGNSDKTQDPTDVNCQGIWWGTAARFAREGGADPFFPNTDAFLSQVVGPVSSTNRTLHFHSLMVAHRVNTYKAEIYGGNSANGPWTSVWVPFNIQNCLTTDCVNETYGDACNQGDRQCLWDDVTKDILGSLNPIQKTIPQGYPYYKVEFLMNYPNPVGTGTGDVGGKLARVYFKVSGGTSFPTAVPSAQVTSTLTLSPATTTCNRSDINRDGMVNGEDRQVLIKNFFLTLTQSNASADINRDGSVDILDYALLVKDFNTNVTPCS